MGAFFALAAHCADHFAAHTLTKKWKRYCKEWGPALKAFNDITAGSGAANVAKWEAEAKAANEKRFTKPDAMDIYDVQHAECGSPVCLRFPQRLTA